MNFNIEHDDIIDIYDELYMIDDCKTVDNTEESIQVKPSTAELTLDAFLVLGSLNGEVKVLVSQVQFDLKSSDFTFLAKVLAAVKKDINNCSVFCDGEKVYRTFEENLTKATSTILCFGLSESNGRVLFETMKNGCAQITYYPALEIIMKDESLKRKLWNSLKTIFNLSS